MTKQIVASAWVPIVLPSWTRAVGGDGAIVRRVHRAVRSHPPPARAESESDIGGIIRLSDKASEDLPGRNVKAIIPGVVPADVGEPDEAARHPQPKMWW
jgi:hypothetical protein